MKSEYNYHNLKEIKDQTNLPIKEPDSGPLGPDGLTSMPVQQEDSNLQSVRLQLDLKISEDVYEILRKEVISKSKEQQAQMFQSILLDAISNYSKFSKFAVNVNIQEIGIKNKQEKV